MNRRLVALIAVLLFASSCSSRATSAPTKEGESRSSSVANQGGGGSIDLTTIQRIESTGRVQDYHTPIPVVDRLVAMGPTSIPVLIHYLDDETPLKAQVVPLWRAVSVGDVALIILTDLFTDSSWEKSTLPEASFNSIVEYPQGSGKSAEQALREFVRKHGRAAIKAKWTRIWEEKRDKIYWDETERCFNVRK